MVRNVEEIATKWEDKGNRNMTKNEFKVRKIDLENRIAEDVGMCHAVQSNENAVNILCDLLYYTNLHTKWHQDVIEAIKGVCPNYFKGKEPK